MILDGMLAKHGKKASLLKDGDKPMKLRPLDAPMKYESEFSTPSSNGEA